MSIKLSEAEQSSMMSKLDGWDIVELDVPQLKKVYEFKNFCEALAFTNRVGELAEAANHHPALLTEWGRVTVRWWSHDAGGLCENDFTMASKTDGLLA